MLEIKTREEAAKGADCAMFPVHIQCDGGSVFGFGLFKRELFAAVPCGMQGAVCIGYSLVILPATVTVLYLHSKPVIC